MGASPYIVTRGIVLRQTVTKDTDKILTLLTEDRGRTPVIARGARKKNCRYAACAQPLAYAEWTLYQRGDWYYVNEGSTLELFQGLREDLEAMALGSYFAELAEAAAVEEVPAGPLLRHLLNGLYALAVLRRPPELVKPVFELKLLSLAGPCAGAPWRRPAGRSTGTSGGCTPSAWAGRPWTGWGTRRRRWCPSSWNGGFGRWSFTRV